MPSVSKKQEKFMAACAHNPKHMKGKCPPEDVAQEFHMADKAKKKGRAKKGGAKLQAQALMGKY